MPSQLHDQRSSAGLRSRRQGNPTGAHESPCRAAYCRYGGLGLARRLQSEGDVKRGGVQREVDGCTSREESLPRTGMLGRKP
jgi:hypothetical protein